MRHFLCTILFLAVLPNAFTQFNVTGSLEAFVTKFGVSQERLDEVDNIDGSHYLLDTYEKGKLLIDGTWYNDGDLRFDVYNSCFEIKLADGIFVLDLQGTYADTVILNNEIFIPRDILPGSKEKLAYLTLLNNKNGISLCKMYRVRYEAPVAPGGYSDAKPAAYRTNTPKYYILTDTEVQEISNFNSIAEAFNKDKKSIKNYMKERNYKLSDEKDLIALINQLSE